MTGEIDGLVGAGRADMDHDRHPAGGRLDRGLGQALALVERQIEQFGEMQVDAERGRVVPQQEFDDAAEGVEIERIVRRKGRHRDMDDPARHGR